MKHYVIIFVLSCSIMFSCSENKQEQIEKLQMENTAFKSRLKEKDSVLLSFMESITNIEQNLVQIRERELSIAVRNKEKNSKNLVEYKKRILSDIETIDKLILDNKKKISELNSLLRSSKNENIRIKNAMDVMKKSLENKLTEQEQAIALLKTELQIKTADIKTLTVDVEVLKDEKKELSDALHKGYYVIGDFQDLREKEVLSKKGGLLGIGRSIALEDNFSTNSFNEVDTREFSTISIEGRKVEIITAHNTGSYAIEQQGEDGSKLLVISDPDKFWEKSHYLVVLTKN